LDGREVVRQQDGVEVEALQAAAVGGGDLGTVAGDANRFYEALLARLGDRGGVLAQPDDDFDA